MRKWGEKFMLPLPIRKKVCMPLSDVVPPHHHTHTDSCNTHFPSSGSHGQGSGMLKSPSCVWTWCIALICRIQALQSRPHLHLILPTLQVSLLVKPNPACPGPGSQQAGPHPATLADPANMWSTWARQTLNSLRCGVGMGGWKKRSEMKRKRTQGWRNT